MPAATTGVVAALDVGGTTIKGLLVDASGNKLEACVRPTPARVGADAVLSAVRAVLTELLDASGGAVRAVGLAVPGTVDGGVARYSANLGWRDVPAAAFVDGLVEGVPVVLDHDARCAALADRVLGTMRGVEDACLVVIGTGISCVLLADGRPVLGSQGFAGELGHVPVVLGGEPCACGQRGCLDSYASAAALTRRYASLSGKTRPAHEIVATAPADPAASQVWQDAIDALATACVTLTMLQDPALITFAGGLAEAGKALISPLTKAVTVGLAWRPPPVLAISPLASWAGRYGIALRAWEAARVTVDPDIWLSHLA